MRHQREMSQTRRVGEENVVRTVEKYNARAAVLVFRVAFTRGERWVERGGRDEDGRRDEGNQISCILFPVSL